jgi:hypothetical protein
VEYSSLNVSGISHKLEELQMELMSKKMDIATYFGGNKKLKGSINPGTV